MQKTMYKIFSVMIEEGKDMPTTAFTRGYCVTDVYGWQTVKHPQTILTVKSCLRTLWHRKATALKVRYILLFHISVCMQRFRTGVTGCSLSIVTSASWGRLFAGVSSYTNVSLGPSVGEAGGDADSSW